MSAITAIRVDGVALDLARVVADLELLHGRGSVFDGPTSSTVRLVLEPALRADARALMVGALLEVDGPGALALFRGQITDSAVVDDDPDAPARLTVAGVGRLRRLGGAFVGFVDYPEESWAARVARVLGEVGLAPANYRITAGSPDYTLAARFAADAGPVDALSYVGELAQLVGAAVYDDPAGLICVQALGARPIGASVNVPAALVVWAPDWLQQNDVVNRITIDFGSAGGSITYDDGQSIARYGLAASSLPGDGFSTQADAEKRARTVLVRRAWSRWSVDELELLEPDPLRAGYHIGGLVNLPTLPASAPVPTFSAMVEAIGLRISGSTATSHLLLSDPVDSGAALAWEKVPADVAWNEAHGRWSDAYTLESVVGGSDRD